MVLDAKKESFSIERFESLMSITGTTWEGLNKELGYEDVRYFLVHKPMKPLVSKACRAIGLDNSDYVMMRSNNYSINESLGKRESIPTKLIDAELLNLHYQNSGWSWRAIATLMSSKSAFFCGTAYLKQAKNVSRDNFYNLCFALRCKANDICEMEDGITPVRMSNKLNKFILNKDKLSILPLDKIGKTAGVPLWFLESESNVSEEMLKRLAKAIKKVTGQDITHEELCINYNKPKTKKSKNKEVFQMEIPNEVKQAVEEMPNTTLAQKERGAKCTDYVDTNSPVRKKHRRNNNNTSHSTYMEEVFNRIDGMTDENFTKLLEYVEASKKLRELRKDLLLK